MAIEKVGWPTSPLMGPRTVSRSTDSFAVAPEQAAGGVTTTSGPAGPACLGAVLSLQEMGDQTVEDREARKHGQDMLALLAALQRSLLTGEDTVAALQQLADLSNCMPRTADRRLAAMISAIHVRARVELARRQV